MQTCTYLYVSAPAESLQVYAVNFLLESKQHQFQLDSVDKSWHKLFFDCDVVSFQFKFSDTTITQAFVCPYGQNDSAFGKKIVNSNISNLFQELKLEYLSDSFVSFLPKDCNDCSYSFGGNVTFRPLIKINLNKRQFKIRFQKRINKIYLDSVSVKLDSFIQSELVRLIPIAKREQFYDYYILHFSHIYFFFKLDSEYNYRFFILP